MVNFGPLPVEIVSLVWGTPANFKGFLVLAALLHATLGSGRQPNFAVLNRGRHLYSAGRPSRWALAHISSFYCNMLTESVTDVVRVVGGADEEDPGVSRQRVHGRPARPVLQAQPLRVPLARRPAAGQGVADELRPARRALPAARRRHHRLRPPHVRRARHLQVDGQLLATQAEQELLEEPVDDVLESGIDRSSHSRASQ